MAFCLKLLQPQPHSTRLTVTRLPWRLKSLRCAPVLLLQDKMCLLDARLVLRRRLYVYHLKMVVALKLYTGPALLTYKYQGSVCRSGCTAA